MAVARNTAEVAWAGAMGASIGDDAVWIGIWDALSAGNFYLGVQVSNNPDALALGEVYYIAALGLELTQTAAANETESMAQRALRGRLDGTLYYAVHTGSPGTNGANEGDLARIAILGSAFTYSDT